MDALERYYLDEIFVMFSGILLTITFSLSVIIVIQQLLKKPTA